LGSRFKRIQGTLAPALSRRERGRKTWVYLDFCRKSFRRTGIY
jgi:hypothetical protein